MSKWIRAELPDELKEMDERLQQKWDLTKETYENGIRKIEAELDS